MYKKIPTPNVDWNQAMPNTIHAPSALITSAYTIHLLMLPVCLCLCYPFSLYAFLFVIENFSLIPEGHQDSAVLQGCIQAVNNTFQLPGCIHVYALTCFLLSEVLAWVYDLCTGLTPSL